MSHEERQDSDERSLEERELEAFGKFLDSSIRLPGGLRIGWDGIIGLVPGVGDAIGLGLSSWLVWRACQLELPRPVIIRMLLNVGVEAVVGIVPIVGDLFDFVFKANNRNVALMQEALESKRRRERHESVTK
jgi:hypothetical protein